MAYRTFHNTIKGLQDFEPDLAILTQSNRGFFDLLWQRVDEDLLFKTDMEFAQISYLNFVNEDQLIPALAKTYFEGHYHGRRNKLSGEQLVIYQNISNKQIDFSSKHLCDDSPNLIVHPQAPTLYTLIYQDNLQRKTRENSRR